MYKVIISGGGVSAWSIANSLVSKNVSINVISKKEKYYGAQQISLNGLKALQNLIETKDLCKKIEKIEQIRILNLEHDNFRVLSAYQLSKKFDFYGTISRDFLVKQLKKNALLKTNINHVSDEVEFIEKSDNKLNIFTKQNFKFVSDFLIGADGQRGLCKNYVIGNSSYKEKKIFRYISNDKKNYMISKKIIHLFLSSVGHFVVYPFQERNQNLVNYVFVPNHDINQKDLDDLKFSHPFFEDKKKWILTKILDYDKENPLQIKNNVFLFGESALPVNPHLAQSGNQIFQDASYIKNNLHKHNDLQNLLEQFIIERYLKRKIVGKNSKIVGEILSTNKILSLPRNLLIEKYSDVFFDSLFQFLWDENS